MVVLLRNPHRFPSGSCPWRLCVDPLTPPPVRGARQPRPRLRPWPLTTDDVRAARTLLRTLKERDEAKRRLAQAKNDLETLIYDTKYDKFFDVEELKVLELLGKQPSYLFGRQFF